VRKISGSTRSEAGRRCRDTFASLKKTCRKLGIGFWAYLCDRGRGVGQIPRLGGGIPPKAQEMAGGPGQGGAPPAAGGGAAGGEGTMPPGSPVRRVGWTLLCLRAALVPSQRY